MTKLGKYEILEEIGRGGFATVYKARDHDLDQVVAVKVLHGAYADQPDVVRRFLNEARKAVKLRHRGIVRMYAVGEDDGVAYIAMEYLPGGTLADRLHGDPLPLDTAIAIVEQVAGALDYAHKRGLVHRDLKPANILFDEEGIAVLVDFGLVKSLAESGMTVTGTSLGTPAYMAPEQADATAKMDVRVDVYALGVVAYEMLTGRVPFEAETPLSVLHAHVHETPPDPCELNQALDKGMATVVLKALEKDPVKRYQSAGAFAATLRSEWERLKVKQLEKQRPRRVLKMRRWGCTLGALAVLLLVGGKLLRYCSPPVLIVESHHNGDLVDYTEEITGTYRNLDPSWHLWSLVQSGGYWWISDCVRLEESEGEWKLEALLGYEGTRSIGETFKFLVLAVKEGSDAEKYLESARGRIAGLPTGQVHVFDPNVTLVRASPTDRWLADFWDNDTREGEPAAAQEITATYIFREWRDAPFDDLSEAGWAARFVRRFHSLKNGTYCFRWMHKGEVSVFIDRQTLNPIQEAEGWEDVESACRELDAGYHEIRLDYANSADEWGALQFWHHPPFARPPPEPLADGWQATFFPTTTLEGPPIWVTTLPGPFLDLEMSSDEIPVISFYAILTHTLALTDAGYYRFDLDVDDGARFYIDDVRVLNERYRGPARYVVERFLDVGDHSLRLEYLEHYNIQYVRLIWEKISPPTPPVQRILFATDRDGSDYDLYVANANGANPIKLTYNGVWDHDPAWSPDGRRIVFASTRNGTPELCIMNADGSDVTSLGVAGYQPRWSPDGSRIAYVAGGEGVQEVYVMDADGTNVVQLTDNQVADYSPDWSPDGSRIVFETGRDGDQEIYVMNADGSVSINLSQNLARDGTPAWSPDGRSIAFFSNRDGNDEIYVMGADGNNQSRLTANELSDKFPTWSPDGLYLIFERTDVESGGSHIHRIQLGEDTPSVQLTESYGNNGHPQWSPPGHGYTFESLTDGDSVHAGAIAVAGDYVWTGGSGGLMRWNRDDPSQQCKFTSEDGLIENNVHTILADSESSLWIGTGGWPFGGSGLSHYEFGDDREHWRTYTSGDGLGVDTILSLYQDSQGQIWAGTYGKGVRSYNGRGWRELDQVNSGGAEFILETADGVFWFGLAGSEVVRYDPSAPDDTGWQRFNLVDALDSDTIGYKYTTAIVEDALGGLWLGTYAGVVHYDGGTWQAAGGAMKSWIDAATRDADGALWFGTWDGLVRLDTDGQQRTYTTDDGLTGIVRALFLDDTGVLWAAGSGLNRYDRENDCWQGYSAHEDQADLADNYVGAILQDTSGAFWLGHSVFWGEYIPGGGVSRYVPGSDVEWQHFGTDDGLSELAVHAIYQDRDGIVWVGFDRASGGVCRYDIRKGRWVGCYLADPNGLASDEVDSIVQTSDGALWFGTSGGGLSRFDRERWETFNQANSGLLSDQVHCLAEDREGALWVTTDQGINRFLYDTGEWVSFTTRNSDLIADEVLAMARDGKDGIWFGTREGLSHYDVAARSWHSVEETPALAGWIDNCVQALHVDRYGSSWVTTDEGLYRQTPEGGWVKLTTTNGLASNHVLAIFEDTEGVLWIGTPSGVSQLHME